MNSFRTNYGFVLKNIKKNKKLMKSQKNIEGKTFVIAGGTRGIGFSIAEHLLKRGANVAILGKTKDPHPKLENTIDSAVNKLSLKSLTGKVHGEICDVRDFNSITDSKDKIFKKFGAIDGVVINASALCLNSTLHQSQKEIDLMTGVNIKGSFNVGQVYIDTIQKTSTHPHVLMISPPLEMLHNEDWWIHHFYYSMSKFNMSMMAKFWNEEFPEIGINTLWPRTTIDTAPVRNLLGGQSMVNISRTPDIMGTAASIILGSCPKTIHGNNFIDDEVCISADIPVEQFRVDEKIDEKSLMPDFFC